MKLSEIGEFGFIARAAKLLHQQLPTGIVGIGDDCAVIHQEGNRSFLITTDMLVENIHFLRNRITPQELGYKALAVNLSDIAAMGGVPHSAYISIAIPNTVTAEWLDDFYSGIKHIAESCGVLILGGDTTKSPDMIVINFAVFGTAHTSTLKYRSSAQLGDMICVTDFLGDSGGGLYVLLNNIPLTDDVEYLLKKHHVPRPHLDEGQWLATHKCVHAMMDVSDGIDSDIRRIMEQSNCGARIDIDKLPLSPQLINVAARYHWNADELALTGGEDYCLLLTVDRSHYTILAEKFMERFKRPLYHIGTIEEQSFGLQYYKRDTPVVLSKRGFDHFQ
ncbi:MAG: thiamine-phosphate kinase [Bacteroidetes bacterium]|nr:thiamine-phosphate kinase [Bacteroidota bacterium]